MRHDGSYRRFTGSLSSRIARAEPRLLSRRITPLRRQTATRLEIDAAGPPLIEPPNTPSMPDVPLVAHRMISGRNVDRKQSLLASIPSCRPPRQLHPPGQPRGRVVVARGLRDVVRGP